MAGCPGVDIYGEDREAEAAGEVLREGEMAWLLVCCGGWTSPRPLPVSARVCRIRRLKTNPWIL